MEKFSQFRDRGSGISPFMPITTPSSTLSAVPRVFMFLFRLPFFLAYVTLYFTVLHYLPLPTAARKLLLWFVMGIPGIWWVDLRIDGVKRGHLASQPAAAARVVPQPGSVIAVNFTSPVDALYLAAVFDPIFTQSFPHSRKVRRISLLRAVYLALAGPSSSQPAKSNRDSSGSGLTDLRALCAAHPDRVIAVFPECGTTNGKGVLPFSPSLLSVPAATTIFPVSLRYTPPDITTPVPGAWAGFLWNLLGRPTHCIRVRIAEGLHNTSRATNGVTTNAEQRQQTTTAQEGREVPSNADHDDEGPTPEEQLVLDQIAEALARLGRAKRVGLTLRDKQAFAEAWRKAKK